MVGEQAYGQVGALDLEALGAYGQRGGAEIVHQAGMRQRLVVDVELFAPAMSSA